LRKHATVDGEDGAVGTLCQLICIICDAVVTISGQVNLETFTQAADALCPLCQAGYASGSLEQPIITLCVLQAEARVHHEPVSVQGDLRATKSLKVETWHLWLLLTTVDTWARSCDATTAYVGFSGEVQQVFALLGDSTAGAEATKGERQGCLNWS